MDVIQNMETRTYDLVTATVQSATKRAQEGELNDDELDSLFKDPVSSQGPSWEDSEI
jgi:hypothetical protein